MHKPGLGDAQHPTHRGHTKLVLVLINELVLYSGWLAKYLAAFLRYLAPLRYVEVGKAGRFRDLVEDFYN